MLHPGEPPGYLEKLRLKWLPAREGQQLTGQNRRPLRRLGDRAGVADAFLV